MAKCAFAMICLLDLGSSMIKRKGENLLNCVIWGRDYEFEGTSWGFYGGGATF